MVFHPKALSFFNPLLDYLLLFAGAQSDGNSDHYPSTEITL